MLEIPNYHVVDSDYENYSIVYSCRNTYWGYRRTELLWILSRDQVMDKTLLSELIAKFRLAVPKYDFDYWFEYTTQGKSCEYEHLKVKNAPVEEEEDEDEDDAVNGEAKEAPDVPGSGF
jgi:hypothetical protein